MSPSNPVEPDSGVVSAVRPTDAFPEQYARTRRLSLGRPRTFSVARDGSRVAFLRSRAGDDPLTCLWVVEVQSGEQRLVADPREMVGGGGEELSAEERARRERARETAGGIVSYATDRAFRSAVTSLGGRLFHVDLETGATSELAAAPPVFDPRPDPQGGQVGYVSGGALRVTGLGTASGDRVLASEDDPDVTWGMAEFVAAEEMDRLRGFWWSPDGEAIAAARVDVSAVQRWYISDPANPSEAPAAVAYPAAGTPNADVALAVLGLDGSRVDVEWDRDAFPYLVTVEWSERGLTLLVQSRRQDEWHVLLADPNTGATRSVWHDRDPAWLEICHGLPAWTESGALVMAVDRDDTRRIGVDGEPVTPPGLQVRRVIDVGEEVLFTASNVDEPEQVHVWRVGPDGSGLDRLTTEAGVHEATARGGTVVIESAALDREGVRVRILTRDGREAASVESFAERPLIEPNVALLRAGSREVRTAVLLPRDADVNQPLPVLLDPYGGPWFQRVVHARDAHLQSQWFAEQGFAVVVADGRGTPGRGVAWEKAIRFDFAGPVLEDQVDALHGAAERYPQLDLSRVAIRGWSFGGELALVAVLRRPDVFHAAISGAPVTDQRLYDTHYTERYLGLPDEHPEAYERSSPIFDAPKLERPLLLIHGLADDNVVVANTLRLSSALLQAGRPHRVLPLAGMTHMTPEMEGHLMRFQVAFLREALGLGDG